MENEIRNKIHRIAFPGATGWWCDWLTDIYLNNLRDINGLNKKEASIFLAKKAYKYVDSRSLNDYMIGDEGVYFDLLTELEKTNGF